MRPNTSMSPIWCVPVATRTPSSSTSCAVRPLTVSCNPAPYREMSIVVPVRRPRASRSAFGITTRPTESSVVSREDATSQFPAQAMRAGRQSPQRDRRLLPCCDGVPRPVRVAGRQPGPAGGCPSCRGEPRFVLLGPWRSGRPHRCGDRRYLPIATYYRGEGWRPARAAYLLPLALLVAGVALIIIGSRDSLTTGWGLALARCSPVIGFQIMLRRSMIPPRS